MIARRDLAEASATHYSQGVQANDPPCNPSFWSSPALTECTDWWSYVREKFTDTTASCPAVTNPLQPSEMPPYMGVGMKSCLWRLAVGIRRPSAASLRHRSLLYTLPPLPHLRSYSARSSGGFQKSAWSSFVS